MPITQVVADAKTVRARGIWVHSLDGNGVNIAWVPQVSGQCGKGTPYVESTNPLAGECVCSACLVVIEFHTIYCYNKEVINSNLHN